MEVGLLWFNDMLPKHFEEGADTKYGYQKRSDKYLKFKRKKAGRGNKYQNKPLTLTGLTRDMATRNARVVANGNQVTITYKVPAYAGAGGKSSFVRQEMKKVTTAEKKTMTRLFMRKFTELQEADNTKVRETV
jgi:HD superfamily phosphodiesterase